MPLHGITQAVDVWRKSNGRHSEEEITEFNEEREGNSTFLVEICQKLQKPRSVQDFEVTCSLLQCLKARALHRRKTIIKRKKTNV